MGESLRVLGGNIKLRSQIGGGKETRREKRNRGGKTMMCYCMGVGGNGDGSPNLNF